MVNVYVWHFNFYKLPKSKRNKLVQLPIRAHNIFDVQYEYHTNVRLHVTYSSSSSQCSSMCSCNKLCMIRVISCHKEFLMYW